AIVLLLALLPGFGEKPGPAPQSSHAPSQPQAQEKIGSAAHIEPLRPGFEFPHGQTLHYTAEYRFVTAGIATIKVEHLGTQEHVAGVADSTGVVAMLFRVQDRFDSFFDASRLSSHKLTKH